MQIMDGCVCGVVVLRLRGCTRDLRSRLSGDVDLVHSV